MSRVIRRMLAMASLIATSACVIVGGDAAPATTSSDTTTCGTAECGTSSTSTSGADSTSSSDTSALPDLGGTDDGSTGDPTPVLPECPSERSEDDRPDDSRLPQVRILYVLPSDGTDDALDTNDRLCNSVRSWTQWLIDQTGGRALRLDTDDGVLDIGFVRLDLDDATMHGTSDAASIESGHAYVRDRIERELELGDGLASQKLYAVYYGGTSEYACGGGAYPPVLVGQVAAMYLGGEIAGYPACDAAPWGEPDLAPRYIDYGMIHELVHSLGAVDLIAPSEHSSGHAFDERSRDPETDLMYSPREGASDPPWGVARGLVLDLNGDDYFEHGDGSVLDISRSAFFAPLPEDPQFPPAW